MTDTELLYPVPVWAWTQLENKAGDGGVLVPPDFAKELIATGDYFLVGTKRCEDDDV